MPKLTIHCLIPAILAAVVVAYGFPSQAAGQVQPPEPGPEPADDSPLLTEPDTNEELFDAVTLMVRLGRPGLAKRYLGKLLGSDPTDDVLLKLRDKYGSAQFLRLAGMDSLQPEAGQLLEKLNAAARKQANDPVRMQALIDDLVAGGTKRALARLMLKNLGSAAVPMLLRRASVAESGEERDQVIMALINIGDPALPVLHGALLIPGPPGGGASAEARVALETLGWLKDKDAVPFLWYYAFGNHHDEDLRVLAQTSLARIFGVKKLEDVDSSGLSRELKRLTQVHLRNAYPWKRNSEGKVEFWEWDAEAKLLRKHELSPQEASLVWGAHFAEEALRMSPEDSETQAIYLALALAAEYNAVGWDKPLPTGPGTAYDVALTAGPDVMSRALRISLDNVNTLAALASLQALSLVASEQQLLSLDSTKSSILAALNYPSGRVQFAAATTILKIDPDSDFAGSDRVVTILARGLSDTQTAHAVIIDPNQKRADKWAGLFNDLGYHSVDVRTGRQGFKLAAERMDIEMIAINANCSDWTLTPTLSNLRSDARTASIPIIVFGPKRLEFELNGLLSRTPLTRFISEETDAVEFSSDVREFLAGLGTPDLTAEQREMQVEAAAYWLSLIASGRRAGIYNLAPAENAVTRGVANPAITGDCLLTLSMIPTESSQRTLFSIVLQAGAQDDVRRSAARQLVWHIQKFGWLLDRKDAPALVKSYEQAVQNSSPVATSLAAVLGVLKPDAKLVGERLQKFEDGQ